MRILMEMTHPKDVNTLKNVIWSLEENHEVRIAARNKEEVFAKLDDYGFDYEAGAHFKGFVSKILGIPWVELWELKVARKFMPDILFGPSSMYFAHVSKLIRKPYVCFSDVERDFTYPLMMPFTDVILVPSGFYKDLGEKMMRFDSYLELAYLHPKYFKPDKRIFDHLDLDGEEYILLRISSLDAHHDVASKGFNFRSGEELMNFIKELEVYGRVFITSEKPLSKRFESYLLKIPVNMLHDCIAYSSLYIGDGVSMAAEAAVLGVPSVYVTNNRLWGFVEDLAKCYELISIHKNRASALNKATELLEDDRTFSRWRKKRKQMLREKIDTTEFLINFLEDFYYKKARD